MVERTVSVPPETFAESRLPDRFGGDQRLPRDHLPVEEHLHLSQLLPARDGRIDHRRSDDALDEGEADSDEEILRLLGDQGEALVAIRNQGLA